MPARTKHQDPELQTAIAAAVRGELAKAGRTGLTAAEALGMSQPAISRRTRGEVPFLAHEMARLAAWLDIPIARLFDAAVTQCGSGGPDPGPPTP
jgi:transcriptional regulator with XRE-family HTH domain